MNTLLSQRLKQLRLQSKETQQDVAETINIKRTTYSAYENGRILPPYDKLKAMAQHYAVNVNYLMGQTNFPNKENEKREIDILDIGKTAKFILDELTNPSSVILMNGSMVTEQMRELLIPDIKSLNIIIDFMEKQLWLK